MNDLLALAEQVRRHYLRALLSSFAEYKTARQPSSLEVLLELQREEPRPFRLYRVDMASNVNGQTHLQEVNPGTHLRFEPFSVEVHDALAIEVHPMNWNGVEVYANTQADVPAIETWALKWLDVDDKHAQDEDGLQGVIHSVTLQESETGTSRIAVDWGSAPIAALEELFQVLDTSGATRVKLSTPGLSEA
jgi:hypothetical protein